MICCQSGNPAMAKLIPPKKNTTFGAMQSAEIASQLNTFSPSSSPSSSTLNLVGGFNPFKDISQNGNLPQVGVKIKKYLRCHHQVMHEATVNKGHAP